MKNALMEMGVPETAITLDFAGLSTLDSVVRSKLIFGQDSLIVVTQKFHGYRAYFLCKSNDVDAEIFIARSVPFKNALMVYIRELFARSATLIDIYILKRTPRHLGERVEIKISEL
jgi:SanA protein